MQATGKWALSLSYYYTDELSKSLELNSNVLQLYLEIEDYQALIMLVW